MTWTLVRKEEPEVHRSGYTYVEYIVRDSVTGVSSLKRAKFLTADGDKGTVDAAITSQLDALNNPPPPLVTAKDVLDTMGVILADSNATDAQKLAALNTYKDDQSATPVKVESPLDIAAAEESP